MILVKVKFAHLLIAHSLICSDCSNQMSYCEQLAQIAQEKWVTVRELLRSLISKEHLCANRSFIMSSLRESLTVAHLSWATWAIRSLSLFWYEWPERFAHSHSFFLSDLSKSLTVAHLIWAIWANEQMSKWANEQWANERIPGPGKRKLHANFTININI